MSVQKLTRWIRAITPALALLAMTATAGAQLSGAIFTTTPDGARIDANIYASKDLVYLNGGPHKSQQLPPGDYYFQVTDPSGKVVLSSDAITARKVTVGSDGLFHAADNHPYNTLSNPDRIVVKLMPYDDTPNQGGEYKAWLTPVDKWDATEGAKFGGFVPRWSKTDNFKVRVKPPTCDITCPPDVNECADPETCLWTGDAPRPTVTGDCAGTETIASDPATIPASFPIGTTTITWTVTVPGQDPVTCTQFIQISDCDTPTLTCPPDITDKCTDLGQCTATVDLGAPTLHETCTVKATGPPTNDAPAAFEIGTTVVNWSVTLTDGQTLTCTQSVTVKDCENPDIVCPDNKTVDPPCGEDGATVAFEATATDNCGSPAIAYFIGDTEITSPYRFDCGTTTVKAVATDAAGNTDACTFDVTVRCVPCTVLTIVKQDASTGGPLGGFKFEVTYTDPRSGDVVGPYVTDPTDPTTGVIAVDIPQGATYKVCELIPKVSDPNCLWIQISPESCYEGTATVDTSLMFTNRCVCKPVSGGLTLGFWSNKNGTKVLGVNYPAWSTLLNSKNLAASNGTLLGPAYFKTGAGQAATAAAQLNAFLLQGSATNMANMLSIQMAALTLTVNFDATPYGGALYQKGSTLIYAPTLIPYKTYLNSLGLGAIVSDLGFITIDNLLASANVVIGAAPNTAGPSDMRSVQEALKNVIDSVNNNKAYLYNGSCDAVYP